MTNKERGNILFLILLAVVLFAALSYAVTSSTRGGGNDASGEKTEALYSDLMNYFAELDLAVHRMLTTGDMKDHQLNFYQTGGNYVWGAYDNTNCTEDRCRVFNKAGGGVSGRKLAAYTRDPIANAGSSIDSGRILYISVPGVGTSAPDIVFSVQGVPLALCKAVNKRLGVNDILNGTYSAGSSNLMYQFAIPVGPIPDVGSAIANITSIQGSYGTFCTCHTYDATNCVANAFYPQIFHVLVAR